MTTGWTMAKFGTVPLTVNNANCYAGNLVMHPTLVFNATVYHTTMQGVPATWVVSFYLTCYYSTPTGTSSGILCGANSTTDGLPVELMEFSVQSDDAETEKRAEGAGES